MKSVWLVYLFLVADALIISHRHARSLSDNNMHDKFFITRKVSKSHDAKSNEDSQHIYEGDWIELSCHYPDDGEWIGKWSFENRSSMIEIPKVELKGLILKHTFQATIDDDGVYTCHLADNQNKTKKVTETIRVTKIVKPFLEFHRNKPFFAHEGNSAHLECDLVGTPQPIYQWLKDGKNYNETGPRLMIGATTASDDGLFLCRASNRAGLTQQNVELRLLEEHPEVQEDTTTYIATTEPKTTNTSPPRMTTSTALQTTTKSEVSTTPVTVSAHIPFRERSIAAIALLILLIFIITATICFVVCIQKYLKKHPQEKSEKAEMFEMLLTPTSDQNDLIQLKKGVIRFTEEIGKGHFGTVHAGLLMRKSVRESDCVDHLNVAIKSPRDKYDNYQNLMLREEFEIVKKIPKHPNIITLIGGVNSESSIENPAHIIFEFCENKSLLEYLRKNKDGFLDLFNTPNGADCVHRDLAARNVLLTANKICRIADFGLTRCHENSEYYRSKYQTDVPIRWMSIEAITEGKYTEKSDVWSFAIVLFELFSLGELPYKEIDRQDLEDHIIGGNINKKPVRCNEKIYDLMKKCWRKELAERPKFSECFDFFKKCLNEHSSEKFSQLEKLIQVEKEKQRDMGSWYKD